jgi:hypothetical protein
MNRATPGGIDSPFSEGAGGLILLVFTGVRSIKPLPKSWYGYGAKMVLPKRKKAKRKFPSKPKIRRVGTGSKGKSKSPATSNVKEKEELIRIWDEDLCE